MQGDSLDTTCTAVVNAVNMFCEYQYINDLSGIQYFDSLINLRAFGNALTAITLLPPNLLLIDVSNNQITSVSNFPSSLQSFSCSHNPITSLPPLPAGLLSLYCSMDSMFTLPSLPPNLVNLDCDYNYISVLPALPSSLLTLNCSNNLLTALPNLPSSLTSLVCSSNDLGSLPTLPSSLQTLSCLDNSLAFLPALPASLDFLDCGENQLTSLPSLPGNLTHLECYGNFLTSLPLLPNSITWLVCASNQITVLPALPDSLDVFYCFTNSITSLPPLPSKLTRLECDQNQLTSLPNLPPSLVVLRCGNNFLNVLPPLDTALKILGCEANQLTALPDLPDSLNQLLIYSNPISCLPEIKTIGTLLWGFTNIHCLPNAGRIYTSTPLIDTLPICQPSGGCQTYWNITGTNYFDNNGNCIEDTNDIGLRNIPVILDSGGVQLQMYLSNIGGNYSFRTGFGNYSLRVDTTNLPFDVVCPVSFFNPSTLSVADSLDSLVNFGLQCRNGFDLAARSISPDGMFSIGHQQKLFLNAGDVASFYGMHCANGIGGSVEAILQGLVTYISPAIGALTPTSINGDTITWNINDFSSVDPTIDFNIILEISTNATINDSICIQLNVLPSAGDNIPSNNSLGECFPILAAYDPNVKYMSPSGLVDTSQQWFEFTVFFQNVGTAPAEDIYILDTLDQNLDATTFTYLSSSHDVITQMLPGNILRFNYPDIYLADSTSDEPASHGYVKFKVKRKENLPLNTTISNTAYIFFDFNEAVVTNTTFATLTTSVGMSENTLPVILVYPNPAQSQLTVESGKNTISAIEILNTMGQQVFSLNEGIGKRQTIDVENFAEGIYIVKINIENKIVVERFIKQ